jgi:hypothetical protein
MPKQTKQSVGKAKAAPIVKGPKGKPPVFGGTTVGAKKPKKGIGCRKLAAGALAGLLLGSCATTQAIAHALTQDEIEHDAEVAVQCLDQIGPSAVELVQGGFDDILHFLSSALVLAEAGENCIAPFFKGDRSDPNYVQAVSQFKAGLRDKLGKARVRAKELRPTATLPEPKL